MPIRRILITGNPVLHTQALAVTKIDLTVKQLVADMFETMDAAPGVGLAAPQVGEGLRIFVFSWNSGETTYRGVAINPSLKLADPPQTGPDEELDSEGCLSIPGERFPLSRHETATLKAMNLNGDHYQIEATGWLARIFQHEYDHLEGTLYSDRLGKPYAKQMTKAIRQSGWNTPGESWLPGQDDLEP